MRRLRTACSAAFAGVVTAAAGGAAVLSSPERAARAAARGGSAARAEAGGVGRMTGMGSQRFLRLEGDGRVTRTSRPGTLLTPRQRTLEEGAHGRHRGAGGG